MSPPRLTIDFIVAYVVHFFTDPVQHGAAIRDYVN
jgi:hypothetical protein